MTDKDSEIQPEDTVTIMEDYWQDDKGVWYRWKQPHEQKWHIKLTALRDSPYIHFKTMSHPEFIEFYKKFDNDEAEPSE